MASCEGWTANTPPTSYYLKPTQRPEYGVLARWSMGARIYQVAKRPVLSTAFGWETHGFFQEAGFWSTDQPSEANRLLRDNSIKYVVVKAVHDLQSDYRIAVKGEEEGALPSGMTDHFNPKRSMYWRLMKGDGSSMVANGFVPALDRYRLVYESDFLAGSATVNDSGVSYYKIYEFVLGARLQGKAGTGLPVTVSLPISTSRNRKFVYFNRVITDSNGDFSFQLPYSTVESQGGTLPMGNYTVRIGGSKPFQVAVTEDDIFLGKTIHVDSRNNILE